jgi:hypothetical protein
MQQTSNRDKEGEISDGKSDVSYVPGATSFSKPGGGGLASGFYSCRQRRQCVI